MLVTILIFGGKMKNIIYLFSAFFIINCSPSIYVSSLTDVTQNVSKDLKINLYIQMAANIEEKNFGILLYNELKNEGFNLIDSFEVDTMSTYYSISYFLNEKSSKINSYRSIPTTETTYGNVDGIINYNQTKLSTTHVPYSYNYTVKKVYLTLDLVDKKCQEKAVEIWTDELVKNRGMKVDLLGMMRQCSKTVWEGYIGVEKDEFKKHPKACVKKLLEYFGTNFEDHVYIDTFYDSSVDSSVK